MYKRPGRRIWYAFLDREHKHISLATADEEQARLNLAELINTRSAQGNAPKKGELSQAILETARRAKVNHTQKHAYDLNLRLDKITAWLEQKNIRRPDKVTLGLVETFKEEQRAKDLSNRTINRYLDAWRKMMKVAVEEGIAPRRTLECFKKLKEPQHQPHQRGLTMKEINVFLKAIDDKRYYWLFRTVIGSGIRFEELKHLRADSVRGNQLVITPLPPGTCKCHERGWTTKNYRYRAIPISKKTAQAARKYAAVKSTINLDQRDVWERLQKWRRAAGIDWHWSIHELRRAWGSHLLAAGMKLANISRWYGHADLKTTMRYLRVVEDDMPDPSDLPI